MNNTAQANDSYSLNRSSKIASHHLDRKAIVYVRQSTLKQVEENQESTRLQYALADKAWQLGWPKERIVVIDKDLGCSGSSAQGRAGFQELVEEVNKDHVGIILGLEISRLARSSSDWYQLLENCAKFATLICDSDGIYDPVIFNDQLLLGLKGTMSEVELHTIKQRLTLGLRAKAQRGELSFGLPRGYVRRPSGEVIKDPDEQVQKVIEIIFETFARKGSIYGVIRYLIDQDIQLP
jgi:DNA invertase Pin-like site-specific DNA recombinase